MYRFEISSRITIEDLTRKQRTRGITPERKRIPLKSPQSGKII